MVVHSEFNADHPAWQRAIPQLQRMIERYPEYVPYGTEDVLNALANGDYIFIEFPTSFLIVTEDRDYLHGVIAAGFDGLEPSFMDHAKQVNDMAISAGFKGFKFSTPRKGWEKTAIAAGFRVLHEEVTYVYGS